MVSIFQGDASLFIPLQDCIDEYVAHCDDSFFIPLQDCIGVIDGTHVPARVPRSESAAYRGRKHYTSQNVLAAVDFDMKFTYVLAGREG